MNSDAVLRRPAPGAPGVEPRWTRGAKDAVGTAYSTSSRVWFTLSFGVLSEVYYPTVDAPQIRSLRYLITDGESFLHEERYDLETHIEPIGEGILGFRVTKSDPAGRYRLLKEIIADPHQSCVLVNTILDGDEAFLEKLHLYAFLDPHLEVGGWHNNAQVMEVSGRKLLVAHRGRVWCALGASNPLRTCTVGFIGTSDGWTDLRDDYRLGDVYDVAVDGNVGLLGEVDVSRTREFVLGLAFGDTLHGAVTTLFQSLGLTFAQHLARYVEQWQRSCRPLLPLEEFAGDGGRLYRSSVSLLLAHEEKTYPGAIIASLSIPWGDSRGDDELGGYHLVWTRDMVQSATGLLAAGNFDTPLRALIYLATSQRSDGGFYQNFWVNGEPYWQGIQLDEVAFPILLAWRLYTENALHEFDPYPMVLRAASFLIQQGPATPQERWEEASGYSPSTLASNIAALTCAAFFARLRGDAATAEFIQDYADFLNSRVECWTVTTAGTLLPDVPRHYIRIHPVAVGDPTPLEDPNRGVLRLANQPPDGPWDYPAKEIVDAGFLELVRYGVRRPGDPLVEDSLRVVDALLKVETPYGPCWRRYNHDGYGQRDDGSPYRYWGVGRLWPLLVGERGHYEFAAGRNAHLYLRTMERFAHGVGLLPEQVWDGPDIPQRHLFFGRTTGAAMPLMWAHAEYLKLLRTFRDGVVFDWIPDVARRYVNRSFRPRLGEVWKPNRHAVRVEAGTVLRIQGSQPFRLRWTNDEWLTPCDSDSLPTALGVEYVDLEISREQRAPLRFTFFWKEENRWEGKDYFVEVFP